MPATNRMHIAGIFLVVLNAVLAGVAADPAAGGITWPFAGFWLGLVVMAVGIVLKEMPSSTQASQIKNLNSQVTGLGGKKRDTTKASRTE